MNNKRYACHQKTGDVGLSPENAHRGKGKANEKTTYAKNRGCALKSKAQAPKDGRRGGKSSQGAQWGHVPGGKVPGEKKAACLA